jgi:hypothetical protein
MGTACFRPENIGILNGERNFGGTMLDKRQPCVDFHISRQRAMGSNYILVVRRPEYYRDLFTVYQLIVFHAILQQSGNVLASIHLSAPLVEVVISPALQHVLDYHKAVAETMLMSEIRG